VAIVFPPLGTLRIVPNVGDVIQRAIMSQASVSLPTPGLVRLVGRVQESRQAGQSGFRTLVLLPSQDTYSHPSIVEIRSKARLGMAGNDVDVVCNSLGYNNKPWKNPETGEIYPPSAQVVLQALAA